MFDCRANQTAALLKGPDGGVVGPVGGLWGHFPPVVMTPHCDGTEALFKGNPIWKDEVFNRRVWRWSRFHSFISLHSSSHPFITFTQTHLFICQSFPRQRGGINLINNPARPSSARLSLSSNFSDNKTNSSMSSLMNDASAASANQRADQWQEMTRKVEYFSTESNFTF